MPPLRQRAGLPLNVAPLLLPPQPSSAVGELDARSHARPRVPRSHPPEPRAGPRSGHGAPP
eukprot:5235324-Alexandrium_andersonii.AAC.1